MNVVVIFEGDNPSEFYKFEGKYVAYVDSISSDDLNIQGIKKEWCVIENYDSEMIPTLDDALNFHKTNQIKVAKKALDENLKELYSDMLKTRAEITAEESSFNESFWSIRDSIVSKTSLSDLREFLGTPLPVEPVPPKINNNVN